ncbi:MAG: twin-arginine translocase TatA/TatE family subunit [Bdellovibrionales bacterium]|nr:twin-arginine translocase TatA/TatE family subunit [Bdellovibrionales bacterium]
MAPSFWQILIVVLIVLFIFGPKKIPGLGKSLGEAIRDFRKGLKDEKEDTKTADQSNKMKEVEPAEKETS